MQETTQDQSAHRERTPQGQQAQEHAKELRDENTQLKESLHARAVIDQATGIVVALGRLTPEQGEQIVHELAQHTGIKVRNVAQLLIDWARTGQLTTELRTELDRQLASYSSSQDDHA
ncbi:ANTAR domain-containing protein [Streptomyces sp. NPDC102487]|uniref:ANTAR domain-containing protein n=1 Tax=Streptomyces sp. NPDC102487 TaxID=3366182 RepID=UPI00381E944D